MNHAGYETSRSLISFLVGASEGDSHVAGYTRSQELKLTATHKPPKIVTYLNRLPISKHLFPFWLFLLYLQSCSFSFTVLHGLGSPLGPTSCNKQSCLCAIIFLLLCSFHVLHWLPTQNSHPGPGHCIYWDPWALPQTCFTGTLKHSSNNKSCYMWVNLGEGGCWPFFIFGLRSCTSLLF